MVCETQFIHTVKLILAWTQLKLVIAAYRMHMDAVATAILSILLMTEQTYGKGRTLPADAQVCIEV